MTDKELDDLFQHTLSGHQMPVPSGMWEHVNPQEKERRRGAFLWWTVLGIAALFLITGTAVWLYHAPSQSAQTAGTTPAKTQQAQSSAKQKTGLPQQPANAINKATTTGTNSGDSSSSQTASVNNNTSHQQRNISNNQNKIDRQFVSSTSSLSKLQNHATSNAGTAITGNQNGTLPDNRNNNQNGLTTNINRNNSQSSNPSEPITSKPQTATADSGNTSIASIQKPDSNHAASANNTATAATVKVKKIHGEKTPALEFMVAGYGDSRNVYNETSQLRTAGVVTFGPISTKEKVLMHSVSLTARIDKPLTRNFSVKTGLQFLQTRQVVSYTYETVNQSMTINSVSADTTVFARLQTKQTEIKATYSSFSVPVLISYHTNISKVSVGATAGVILNAFSWYGGKVPDAGNGGVKAAKTIFRPHTGTSLYAGITAARQVGGFQLFAEPHIQYTLSSITKNSASFRQKITGYGFGIGIRKTIGK